MIEITVKKIESITLTHFKVSRVIFLCFINIFLILYETTTIYKGNRSS